MYISSGNTLSFTTNIKEGSKATYNIYWKISTDSSWRTVYMQQVFSQNNVYAPNIMLLNVPTLKIRHTMLINKTKFKILSNGITVITGNNGSGKTMLLKYIFGELINKSIGACYVEQSNDVFLSRCTILENITMSSDPAIIDTTMNLLKKYRLLYLLEHKIKEISGGEKRIISIIRGVVRNEPVLLIDEPTNDLDIQSVEIISKIIQDYSRDKTVIIVGHDDRIIKLADLRYNIEQCELKEMNHKAEIELYTENTYINDGADKIKLLNFMRKCLFGKWIRTLVLVFFMIVFFEYYLGQLTNEKNIAIDSMPHNIITIFSDLTLDVEEQLIGSVPGRSLAAIFDEDKSISEKVKEVGQSLEQMNHESLFNNISLDFSSEKYTFYPINYFDFANREPVSALYDGKISDDGTDTFTSYSFIDFLHNSESREKISGTLFDYYEGKLKDNVLCVGAVVELNDIDFYEFIDLPEVRKLMKYNFRIKSRETERFIRKQNEFILYKSLFQTTTIIGGMMLVIIVIIFIAVVKINSDAILLCRNAGTEKKMIMSIYNRTYKSPVELYLIELIMVLFSIYKVVNARQSYILILAPFMLVIIDHVCNAICRKIFSMGIKHICDWRYRR